MKRFLNEAELEELTGVSRKTFQRHRVFGTGPKYRKLGGAVRYDVADVEAWIASCPVGGAGRRIDGAVPWRCPRCGGVRALVTTSNPQTALSESASGPAAQAQNPGGRK